jgi:predicted secreted protein
MDNDEAHVAGDFFLHSMTSDTNRRKTFLEHFQRFIPQQTIIYIQYCLLRIPFILIYDYLFTEKFSSLIEHVFQYLIKIIDQENHIFTKPINYLLHNSLFQILTHLNLLLSIPILGLLVLILLLLSTDRRLVIFYSYTISLLVIYFDYQMSSMTENPTTSSINMYILQFLLSSIYIQMLNIRPRVRSYKIQTRLCHFAPFVLLITRYLISSKYSIYLLKCYYLIWTIVHFAELFICHRETMIASLRSQLINELYQLYRNVGVQALITYLQTEIHVGTLLKIFWLTKIIVLPLGIRTIYTNPYLTNVTLNINTTNLNENITLEDKHLNYNETLIKTIYFTSLFYGTETMFT